MADIYTVSSWTRVLSLLATTVRYKMAPPGESQQPRVSFVTAEWIAHLFKVPKAICTIFYHTLAFFFCPQRVLYLYSHRLFNTKCAIWRKIKKTKTKKQKTALLPSFSISVTKNRLHKHQCFIMIALWQTIIFLSRRLFFFLLLFFSPNLSRRRLDVCHTSTHDVALVRI